MNPNNGSFTDNLGKGKFSRPILEQSQRITSRETLFCDFTCEITEMIEGRQLL